MTTGTALRASLTIPGQPEYVRDARQLVTRTMGAAHPCTDMVVLMSSEIVTNSIRHSGSGLPGGTVTITVTITAGWFRVEVLDAGGASVPHVEARDDALAEGGQGLLLVSQLAASWGYRHEDEGVVTWFEMAQTEPASERHPSGTAPRQTSDTVTGECSLTGCEGTRS